jgi:hypothetical protein
MVPVCVRDQDAEHVAWGVAQLTQRAQQKLFAALVGPSGINESDTVIAPEGVGVDGVEVR